MAQAAVPMTTLQPADEDSVDTNLQTTARVGADDADAHATSEAACLSNTRTCLAATAERSCGTGARVYDSLTSLLAAVLRPHGGGCEESSDIGGAATTGFSSRFAAWLPSSFAGTSREKAALRHTDDSEMLSPPDDSLPATPLDVSPPQSPPPQRRAAAADWSLTPRALLGGADDG